MKNNPYRITRTAKKWFFEDRIVKGDKTLYHMGDMGLPYPTVDDQWLKERVLFVWEMWLCVQSRFSPSDKHFVLKDVFNENYHKEKWQRWQTLRALNIKDGEAFLTLLHQ